MAKIQAPAATYILAGPETGKRSAFIADIRAACIALDGAPPEEHRLYSQDAGPGELLGLLRNASLFSARRLVEYRGAETIRTKADIGDLAAYVASPAAGVVLFLVTDGYGIEKPLEAAVGAANKKTFYEMFENEKPRWVRDRLARDGVSIDAEGIDALLELVENESSALESACLSLAAGFPKGSALGASDVEASLARTRQEDAFSLFDRIAGADLESALSVLDGLLADRKGDAVQIIGALVWNFRRLERLHAAIASGSGFEEACMKQGVRSKAVQRKTRLALERFPAADCARCVRAASETDGALRSGLGTMFERTLLHLLLYSIMEQRGLGTTLSVAPEEL